MKLSCNVTRDLLPLYHDGVCSGESGALVEEHLAECENCRGLLNELRGEIEVPREEPDDLAPLEKIGKNVKKGKKKAWLRGAAAVLAAVLVIVAGTNIWWYADTYCYYQQFAEGRELVSDGLPVGQGNTMIVYDVDESGKILGPSEQDGYLWTEGLYIFFIKMPDYLRDNGEIQVALYDQVLTKSIQAGREVEVMLYIGREPCLYTVRLRIIDRTASAGQAVLEVTEKEMQVMLDQDLNLFFPDYLDEEDIARQKQIMEDHHLEIMRIIQAAQSQWPFLAE